MRFRGFFIGGGIVSIGGFFEKKKMGGLFFISDVLFLLVAFFFFFDKKLNKRLSFVFCFVVVCFFEKRWPFFERCFFCECFSIVGLLFFSDLVVCFSKGGIF